MASSIYDLTQPIARRWFGSKNNNYKVNCAQRNEYDYLWEMIQFMPDPSLDESVLEDLKKRNLPVPYRWITVAVVEPYIIEGIYRSIIKEKEEKNA